MTARLLLLTALLLAAPLPLRAAPAPEGPAMQRPGARVKPAMQRLRTRVKPAMQKLRTRVKPAMRRAGRALQRTKQKLRRSRAGRLYFRASRQVRRASRMAGATLTHATDRLQGKLRPRSSRLLAAARRNNPLLLPVYSLYKFKRDPVFLSAYGGASWAAERAVQGAMLKLGAGLGPAMVIPSLLSKPIDLAVILARQHKLNPDPNKTLRSTMRGMVGEYRTMVSRSQRHNRRVYRLMERARARHAAEATAR